MHRKLLPLALMYAGDQEPIEGRTRLQKMVFLMQQRFEKQDKNPVQSNDYEFIAYDYGPFSKDLYSDLDHLSDQGRIQDTEEELRDGNSKYIYSIEDQGVQFVEQQLNKEEAQQILDLAEEIKDEYNDVLLSDLIETVYSKYPKYAENSIY